MPEVSSVEPAHFGLERGAVAVRRIEPRTDRLTMPGWFPTSKGTLPSLRTESQLELDGLELFEANPDCVLMAAQPHHLIYFAPSAEGGSVRRRYTPDAAILMSDGTIAVVDFKVEKYARSETWRRLEAILIEAYREDHHVTFKTVTDAMIAVEPRRSNARAMVAGRPILPDPEADLALESAIDRLGLPARLGDLVAACGLANPYPGSDRAFAALMGFALTGRVDLDQGVPLGPGTIVDRRATAAGWSR